MVYQPITGVNKPCPLEKIEGPVWYMIAGHLPMTNKDRSSWREPSFFH